MEEKLIHKSTDELISLVLRAEVVPSMKQDIAAILKNRFGKNFIFYRILKTFNNPYLGYATSYHLQYLCVDGWWRNSHANKLYTSYENCKKYTEHIWAHKTGYLLELPNQ